MYVTLQQKGRSKPLFYALDQTPICTHMLRKPPSYRYFQALILIKIC